MERIGIRELRGDLAAIVRLAGGGNEVIVTVDGLPVAQLGPLRNPGAPPAIDELVRRGELLPATGTPVEVPATRVVLPQGQRIDRLVREIRGR